MKKIPQYECVNVADEVIYTGTAPEVLAFYQDGENEKKVYIIREVGKKQGLVASIWVPLAKVVQGAVEKHTNKKKEREVKKNGRREKRLARKSSRKRELTSP